MKKRMTRLLACLMALLFVILPLTACANGGSLRIVKNGESKYRIVYENASRDAGAAAEYLAEELEYLTGAVLEVTDDRTESEKGVPEILVGRTNRGTDYALQRTVRHGSYVIAREKKNIYILGAGSGVLTKACDDFLSEVMDESCKVSGKGVLLASEGKYIADTVTLNGRPVTDYTVYIPETGSIDWKSYVGYVEEQLIQVSGFMLTTATYTDPGEVKGPAIVLENSTTLEEGAYSIEKDGDKLRLSAKSEKAAIAMAVALIARIADKAGDVMELSLESCGGKAGENPMVPLTDGADIRVMTYNVYATTSAHKGSMPYVSASMYAFAPDFVCMQEFPSTGALSDLVVADMRKAGYGLAGGSFSEVSPIALKNADTDENYQRFANVGKNSYTPIFYRSDRWEVVEEGSYLFYWKNRYHMTNTKSLAYGVFQNKETAELVLIISTHFPLMAAGYVGQGDQYMTYAGTDPVQGAAWRDGAVQEILNEVEEMRAKYPGILTVVGGDMNAKATENSMKTMENHAVLSNATNMAPNDMKSNGTSFHDYGKQPSATGLPIDHLFVSDDVASVLRHLIVGDKLTVQGSDHCPVLVDIARK